MAEFNETVKNCRYCGRIIKKELVLCTWCGYNFKTDTVDPSFNTQQPGQKGNTKEAKAASSDQNASQKKSTAVKLKNIVPGLLLFLAMTYALYFYMSGGLTNLIASFTPSQSDKNKKSTTQKKDANVNPAQIVLEKVFPPPKKEEKRKTMLQLEGIAFDPTGKSFATLNGQIVSEGDNLGVVKIIRIYRDYLDLSIGGVTKQLRMGQGIPLPEREK